MVKNPVQQSYDEAQTTEGEQAEQREECGTNLGGSNAPPLRELPNQNLILDKVNETDKSSVSASDSAVSTCQSPVLTENTPVYQTKPLEEERDDLNGGNDKPPLRGVPACPIECHKTTPANTPCLIVPVANAQDASTEDTIFTHQTEPFLPACVLKILELVQIGEDVTAAQVEEVKALISKFADCFALSLNEVNLIPGAVHKLNIPKDTTFCTKIPQCSFNPDQHAFMEAKVDEMLKGGIIHPIHPRDVKCVVPLVLAHKVHGNMGLSEDELKHKVNDECVKHGLPTAFDLPPCPPLLDGPTPTTLPKKWCLCQDFGEINKVTPIASTLPPPHMF